MERLNFVKNGVLRLPPGFRFHPTDEELVVQYLKRKVFSFPVPASIIPEFHVCNSDPWDFPGDSEQERYFFSTREVKYPNGNRSNRATASGYWKATGIDKQIVITRTNQLVGMKKTLVFYRGKPPHGSRTDWIMHEYRLVTPTTTGPPPNINSTNHHQQQPPCKVELGNWVICRIFLKKRSSSSSSGSGAKIEEKETPKLQRVKLVAAAGRGSTSSRPVFYDFLAKENNNNILGPPPSSSSCSSSSGITDDVSSSSNQLEDIREESSSYNNLSPSPSSAFRRN